MVRCLSVLLSMPLPNRLRNERKTDTIIFVSFVSVLLSCEPLLLAKNPTNAGKAVIELQQRLPMARVIYVSATGASEPGHMRYMTRVDSPPLFSPDILMFCVLIF